MRHRVRDDQLLQLASVECVNGITTKNTMRDNGNGLAGAMTDDHICSFDEGSARVGHVVDYNGNFAFDVSNENHAAHFVRARALLVDECKAQVETISDRCCPEDRCQY